MKSKNQLKELRAKSDKELILELKNSYNDLRKFLFQLKIRELKDVSKVKKTKIKIAQILTILREKLKEETDEEKTKRQSNKR
jgi:ribosomal protein L29